MRRFIAIVLLSLLSSMPLATVEGQNYQRGKQSSPVYQRSRNVWAGMHNSQAGRQHAYAQRPARFHRNRAHQSTMSGSYFQRPYPYHLDYYRMRYGGSYAPYSGNLYGPPQVYAPSNYYGGYSVPSGEYYQADPNVEADTTGTQP